MQRHMAIKKFGKKLKKAGQTTRKVTLGASKTAVYGGKMLSAAGYDSQGHKVTTAGRAGRAAARGQGIKAAGHVKVLQR